MEYGNHYDVSVLIWKHYYFHILENCKFWNFRLSSNKHYLMLLFSDVNAAQHFAITNRHSGSVQLRTLIQPNYANQFVKPSRGSLKLPPNSVVKINLWQQLLKNRNLIASAAMMSACSIRDSARFMTGTGKFSHDAVFEIIPVQISRVLLSPFDTYQIEDPPQHLVFFCCLFVIWNKLLCASSMIEEGMKQRKKLHSLTHRQSRCVS